MSENKQKINHTLRQLSLLGLGLYAEAEDRIKDYVDELVSEGEISKEEGKKFLAELRENSKKQKTAFDEKVREKISRSSEETDKKIKDLEEKIRVLEKQLSEKGKTVIPVEENCASPADSASSMIRISGRTKIIIEKESRATIPVE